MRVRLSPRSCLLVTARSCRISQRFCEISRLYSPKVRSPIQDGHRKPKAGVLQTHHRTQLRVGQEAASVML